ncbi:hypothetical protein LOTGIDRAFT_173705 [Lottia gigantea]|uniref:Uncharacterized protein n=1 Tax=Lottia gigantea TaxID=225164 RepID=V4A6L0_LOTGI|nr:hypothetical protein LOTGIDRAFT_173705 [Lottia gigantea]ESO99563.1 hypothetical protein LOTGIDRAFT_173705 [Lottia gigantea]
MVVYLDIDKKDRIRTECKSLIHRPKCKIRDLARVIGILVSSSPAVELGPMHYRSLEKGKIKALKYKSGDFDKSVNIDNDMKVELGWRGVDKKIIQLMVDRSIGNTTQAEKVDDYRNQIMSTFGEILKFDSTKKICQKISGAGKGTAEWCINIGNENSLILSFVLTCKESTEKLKPMAESLMDRYKTFISRETFQIGCMALDP